MTYREDRTPQDNCRRSKKEDESKETVKGLRGGNRNTLENDTLANKELTVSTLKTFLRFAILSNAWYTVCRRINTSSGSLEEDQAVKPAISANRTVPAVEKKRATKKTKVYRMS